MFLTDRQTYGIIEWLRYILELYGMENSAYYETVGASLLCNIQTIRSKLNTVISKGSATL